MAIIYVCEDQIKDYLWFPMNVITKQTYRRWIYEITDWCNANEIAIPIRVPATAGNYKLLFITDEDAAAFKLKWL